MSTERSDTAKTFARVAREVNAAYEAAVQRVMDKFGGDVRAMAVEIVRLRDELAISGAFDPGDDSNA